MFDLVGISENVIAAVIGAVLVGVGSLIWKYIQQRNPIEWFDIVSGYTTNGEGGYKDSVAYRHIILKNNSRRVVENISLLTTDSVNSVKAPKGTRVDIEPDGEDSRVRIEAIQPKSSIELEIKKERSQYFAVRTVFVGNHDIGGSVYFKRVKNGEIFVPFWVLVVMAGLSLNVLYDALLSPEMVDVDTTPAAGAPSPEILPAQD